MTVQLDAEQIDALSEIFNIGVGKAAAAMGSLMRDEVLLSVPHVSIFTVSEAAQQLGAAGSTMVAWQISHTVQVLPWPSAQVDVGAGVAAAVDAQ